VRGEERADDELAAFYQPDSAADFLDDAAILVAHRRRLGRSFATAVGPQVGAADAGRREPDEGIRRLDDRRVRTFLETQVARTVKDCAFHVCLSFKCSA